MQRWSPETIAFMTDASEYGNYHERLAKLLQPWLPIGGHVCDAGCGLGYLAQAIAPYCAHVTAIDCAAAAIQAAKSRSLPENMELCCADICTLNMTFDAMIFCYFGRIDEILAAAHRLCKGIVIIVKRSCVEHRFSIGPVEHCHVSDQTQLVLNREQIPYRSFSVSLEMGQPFASMEDALRFFRLYNCGAGEVTEQTVHARLRPLHGGKYAYYLPQKRDMEVYLFDAQSLKGR